MKLFVEFPDPIGLKNMNFVDSYGVYDKEGAFGIKVSTSGGVVSAMYPSTNVYADITHGNITATSTIAGVAGNSTTLALVNSGAEVTLNIEVTGTDIVVNLSTSASVITSTEADVVNALNADELVLALIGTIYVGDGTTLVGALSATSLSDGADDDSETTRDALITNIDTEFKL